MYIRACHLALKVKMGKASVPSPSRSRKFTLAAGHKKINRIVGNKSSPSTALDRS
jgi:hypothetical protein